MSAKFIFFFLATLFTGWFIFITPIDRFADPDAFYHITIAKLIHEQGPITEFPWLDLTTLGINYADQHFLFHILQIPFLLFLNPLRASQVSSIFFAVFCMLGISYTFYKLKLNHWWLWPILLVFTQPFTTRLIQGKASPLAILFWFTAIGATFYFLRRDKPRIHSYQTSISTRADKHSVKLISSINRMKEVYFHETLLSFLIISLLSFLFTLTHGGWVLLPISIILILLTNALWRRFFSSSSFLSDNWKIEKIYSNYFIIAVILAPILAIFIHPNRNKLFSFLKVQIFDVAISAPKALRLGTEWNSGNVQFAFGILGVFGIIILIIAIAHVAFKDCAQEVEHKILNARRNLQNTIILFSLSLLLFFASLKSLRFAEYFQPLLALQTAFFASTINWKQFFKNLRLPLIAKFELSISFIILISIILILIQHIFSAYNSTHHAERFLADQYQIPMQAISAIANPGDRVYHSMWDEFPVLFFYNQNLRYISGMDPTFFYKADPELAMTYQDLVYNASTTADLAYDFIHNRLQARFIIIDYERWPAFAATISNDSRYIFLAEGNGAKSYIIDK